MHLDPMIFDEHSLRNLEVLYSKNKSFGILYSPLTKQHFPLYYTLKNSFEIIFASTKIRTRLDGWEAQTL